MPLYAVPLVMKVFPDHLTQFARDATQKVYAHTARMRSASTLVKLGAALRVTGMDTIA